jgi:hypothetical protein
MNPNIDDSRWRKRDNSTNVYEYPEITLSFLLATFTFSTPGHHLCNIGISRVSDNENA